SVVRAQFAEALAAQGPLCQRQHDAFLKGLFSLLDVLLGRPLAELLAELPLAEDLQAAWCGDPNDLRDILEVLTAYEQGDWDGLTTVMDRQPCGEAKLPELYRRAIQASDEVRAGRRRRPPPPIWRY